MQEHHKPNTSTGRPLVLVTGASTGIGLELARVFADNGFDLIITAEDDKLAATEASLAGNGARSGRSGPTCRPMTGSSGSGRP